MLILRPQPVGGTHTEPGSGHSIDHFVEIRPSEVPFKRPGDGLIVRLETEQPILDLLQRGEVVRCEDLSLDDGKVDLNLIEPTGMDRPVDGNDSLIGRLKTFDRGLAAMRGAIIKDPEHTAGITVRGLIHHLGNQTVEWINASSLLTTSEHFCSVDIECSQISLGSAASVLVFDAGGLTPTWRQGNMLANPCLDTGFLVGADDKLVGP